VGAPKAAARPFLVLVPLIVLAPALLLLGAAAGGRGLETDLPATGDYAALELYTRLAAQGRQLLGPYSRFGFHHPGPAYFYASVPLYLLSGQRFTGILLTAALVNVVSIALILRRLGRDGGLPALLSGALVLASFLSWRGPGWLFSAWNPNVAVLPFGLALVECAAFAAGRSHAAATAVLAGSFAAQTHLGCLPATLALGLAAGALRLARVRRAAGLPALERAPRAPLIAAAAIAVVLWALPIVEQLRPDGGNLAHILGFSSLPGEGHPAFEALAAAGAAVVGWLAGAHDASAAALLGLVVASLALAHGAARRTRQAFPAALALVTFAGVAAAILSAARVTGPLLPYLLRWMAMLSVGAAAALAAGLAPLLRARVEASRRPRLAAAAALVALALVGGRNLALARAALQSPSHPPEEAQAAARLAAAVASGLATTSRRPLVEVRPHTDRDLVLGVLLGLDKTRTRFAVQPFGPFKLGGRWTPDGSEDARLVLGEEDGTLAATPSVRLLGREAGLFAYLLAPAHSLRGGSGPAAPATDAAPSRPDILLVLVEGLGAAGARRVPTPHLDRLAARGRRFDAAFSQYPLAGASRTSLLTGWRPEKTGVWGEPEGRVDGATPLQEHFHASGFFTARLGAVYHGPGEASFLWDAAHAAPAGGPAAARAATVLAQAREPFLVAVALGSPPTVPSAAAGAAAATESAGELPSIAVGALDPLARPGGTARPRRLADGERKARMAAEDARLAAADAQVGTILDALDRRGLAPRTIVVLAGDGGGPTGAHGAIARADLLFDETLRVPLVIAGPGVAAPGAAAAGLVELVDVYPTLVEMAGVPAVAGLDGLSLVPVLKDPGAVVRPAALSSVGREAGQIGRSLRTARYRYTEWPDGSEELYDHQDDPREITNLASRPEQARVVAEMRRLLAAREKAPPPPGTRAAAPGRRLSVLFILVDDLNTHVGAWGQDVATPNIDRLAARGRRFDRAYAQVAMCSPSRSSLLSGWRPERTDIWTNLTPVRQHLQGARPLQEHFHASGYFTGRVGKIYEGAMSDQFDWDFDDERLAPTEEARRDDDAVRGAWWVATANDDAHEPDGARARLLARLIEERGKAPFFLAAGFSKPHLKWVAPKRYFDLYPPDKVRVLPEPADDLQDIPAIAIKNRPQERPGVPLAGREPPGMIDDPQFRREAIAAYHACVSFVDAQVGVLMETLDRLALWDSTIVVLVGDHGFHLGEHHGLWRKDTLFEETLHTPLVIVAPQVRRPGVAAAAEVELLDLYPTLVELAGLPRVPGLDGASLVPILLDPEQRVRTGALSFRKAKAPPLGVSVRTARYRYTEWPDGSEELYDHTTDPGETRNQARDPAAAGALAEMRALRAAAARRAE
jgi:iduronate 2-sulfatase